MGLHMEKTDKKKKCHLPTGLAAKLIRFVVLLIVILGVAFFTATAIQVHLLGDLIADDLWFFGGLTDRLARLFHWKIIAMLVFTGVFVVIACIIVSRIARKRVEPINRMTERIREMNSESDLFEMEELYRTGDEIETLALTFAEQSRRLKETTEENLRNATEKERLKAEMGLAMKIQESMLPHTFPAFPDRKDFDLYAHMAPAKTVGGDFYDFFFVDEDHLALVIGDVADKGITAALFMAQSKQVLQNQLLRHNGDVKAAMEEANRRLYQESVEDMFVTVWLGVVSFSDHTLTFIDAGHDYPAFAKGKEGFSIVKDNHSFLMAALPETGFRLNTVDLSYGDRLFLYTDGVIDTHNENDEMFGKDGMLAALNEDDTLSPEELDKRVRLRAREFAGDREQFDDTTTLVFYYYGKRG